jgi:hypothetical protein
VFLLERAEGPQFSEPIGRLALQQEFRRLRRAHSILGLLLGISPNTPEITQAQEVGFARFIGALRKLMAAVITAYSGEGETDRAWRTTLLGPFRRHVEQYRERRRRQEQRAPKAEPSQPPPATPREDSGV